MRWYIYMVRDGKYLFIRSTRKQGIKTSFDAIRAVMGKQADPNRYAAFKSGTQK